MLGGKKKTRLVELQTPSILKSFLETSVLASKPHVKRITDVYDVDALFRDHINAHLRGLGHSGWVNGKNPIHCLTLSWSETKVLLRYKHHEQDQEWYPRALWDGTKWAQASVDYCVLPLVDEEFIKSRPLLSKRQQIKTSNTLRTSILKCEKHFCSWDEAHSSEWNQFFDSPSGFGNDSELCPWFIADTVHSIQVAQIEDEISIAHPPASPGTPPELLVCSDSATAEAWSASRLASRADEPPFLPAQCEAVIGDVLLVFGDQESVLEDEAAGYSLPVSFGRVTETEDDHVLLTWYFAESFGSKFGVWYDAPGVPRTTWLLLSKAQHDNEQKLVKILFTKASKLRAVSIRSLEKLLGKAVVDQHMH